MAARDEAKSALGSAPWPSVARRCLFEGLPIWPDVDWPRTFERIGAAVDSNDPALWSNSQDDLERLLGHLIAHGQGTAFRAWMAQSDWATRVAPLYHAVIAAIEGEDHLLTINPETRRPAAAIYEGIARRVKIFSAGRESKVAKRR